MLHSAAILKILSRQHMRMSAACPAILPGHLRARLRRTTGSVRVRYIRCNATDDLLARRGSVYESIYQDMDRDVGLEIAEKSHKDVPRVPGDGWFYGELSWEEMYDLISLAQPEEGDVFLDMGSGLGKMVLSTAMTRCFKECRGVEILPELAQKASAALERLAQELDPEEFASLPRISLVEGDMFRADLSDADIVYCFATCLTAEVLQGFIWKVEAEMKSGARLLIISKQVESDYFDPWIVPYKSVEQAHSKWNLDCFLYVHK